MKTVGDILRKARAKKNLTREQAAKKLKISAGYYGHLECDNKVWLSDKLTARAVKALGASARLFKAQEAHNKRASKLFQARRASA